LHFSAGEADARGAAAATTAESSPWFRWHAYVPYDAWLGTFAAVVHHGGAGVMYECIRAGKPALVWPLDYDQFDHAARMEHAGVGRRLRRWRELPDALASVLRDDGVRARVAAMQRSFAAYDAGAMLRALVTESFGQSG
jgi:UDP:flavonoid glycosyltransferase YjiC (YdhE family)